MSKRIGSQRIGKPGIGKPGIGKPGIGKLGATLAIALSCAVPAVASQPGPGPIPVRTYDSFGFAYASASSAGSPGKVVVVARNGIRHKSDPSGRIATYREGAEPVTLADTAYDDRDVAGGVTRAGTVITFFARYDASKQQWLGLNYIRAGRDQTSEGTLSTASNLAFSPYGGLVILPSGRVMQTFYGWDGSVSRLVAYFSDTDGYTWTGPVNIDTTAAFRPAEGSAVFVDGTTDAKSRLLLVSRSYGYSEAGFWQGLMQYASSNGGQTWSRTGLIEVTRSSGAAVPWLHRLAGGRIAMVWADRGTMTLRASIARGADVLRDTKKWPKPKQLYRSRVPAGGDKADFGYPSVVSMGPRDDQQIVVFNDLDPTGQKIGDADQAIVDVDLLSIPLTGSNATTVLSP